MCSKLISIAEEVTAQAGNMESDERTHVQREHYSTEEETSGGITTRDMGWYRVNLVVTTLVFVV